MSLSNQRTALINGVSVEQSEYEPKDRTRVDLGDEAEVRWWCKVLGVTRDELESTVQEVGPDAHEVRSHLRK